MGHNLQINYLITVARVQPRYLHSIHELMLPVTCGSLPTKNHPSLKQSSLMTLPDIGSQLNLPGNKQSVGGC